MNDTTPDGADPTTTAWCVGGNNLVTAEQMAGELADVRIYDATQSASWVARDNVSASVVGLR